MSVLPDASAQAVFEKILAAPDLAGALKIIESHWGPSASLSTSFSLEDQIIAHHIFLSAPGLDVFTLDTGRLFKETYAVWSRTLERYGKPIRTMYPKPELLETYVAEYGPNAFYQSVELRKQCCNLRKVEPLQRALSGKKVWITGIRAAHSSGRSHMPQVEWDPVYGIIKFHPLLNWTDDMVRDEISKHNIPYNVLHDRGFVSIGCEPCTRAIKPGEDFRAGRWWWEDADKKECGLHVHEDPQKNEE
ncbi:MAG: phosphoadenylyl-sulfate reductase [Flavobacteriales bacterium]|nr:phosphoadenylyl-sulfate reductase [Flavobacteriales bacterium]